MQRTRIKPVNGARRRRRFVLNYGSSERVEWFHSRGCECKGQHPACQGTMQASHTRSKVHRGNASTIITQSAGCHGYVGTKGWAQWESEVGELLGLGRPLDRHTLAATLAVLGPDAPGVSS